MLVHTGGRGLTEGEYRALLAAAGFQLYTIIPLRARGGLSLIEGISAQPASAQLGSAATLQYTLRTRRLCAPSSAPQTEVNMSDDPTPEAPLAEPTDEALDADTPLPPDTEPDLGDAGTSKGDMCSDRAAKAEFAPVDGREVLARLAAIPIETWRYRGEDAGGRHIGPMAQDFAAAFGLGGDDRSIRMVDANGVAMAAIQGLYQLVQDQAERIAALEAQLRAQEQTAVLSR